jgi:hypothetical protein
MEEIFRTNIKNYRDPSGKLFFSAATELQIPSELVGKINGLIGLPKIGVASIQNTQQPIGGITSSQKKSDLARSILSN